MARGNVRPDLFLLGIVVFIIAFGILILASVSAPYSLEKFGTTFYFLRHQILFGLIPGLILAFFAFRIDLSRLKKWAPRLLLFNLILMIMVFLPVIGSGSGSAARWIYLGPFSFQPSELLKLTFILYLASWLSSRTPHQNKFGTGQTEKITGLGQTFFAFIVILIVVATLLFFQKHASTLAIILVISAIMYFSVNLPLWHSILMILIGVGGLFSLIKFAPYRANRFLVFLHPDMDPMGIGYQINQALIAIGSGGLVGLGLSMSTQKWGFLPQTISDSIFAIFSEETGFIGSIFLIFLFLIFLWRGFKIAKNAKDGFSQLLSLGITSWIILQAFVNIGAMTGILPLTGVPLPFISYGGSALAIELVGAGLLLNVSKAR